MSRRNNSIASDENNTIFFNDVARASTSDTTRLQTGEEASNQTRSGVNTGQISSNQPHSEQQAPPDVALTQAGRPRQRRAWTTHINEALLRTYYRVTHLETDLTGFRSRLHLNFTTQHRDYNVSEQRLSDQIRVIHRNNLISEARRNILKEEISTELNNTEEATPNNADQIRNRETGTENQNHEVNQQPQQDMNEPTDEDHNLVDSRTRDTFHEIYALYDKTDPTRRPPIPKVNSSKKVSVILQDLNDNVLPCYIDNINDITTMQTIVYCAAITVAMRIGKTVNINVNNEEPTRNRTNRTNPWLKRIEEKIKEFRRCISKLKDYMRTDTPSRRLKHKVRIICRTHNTHSRYENNEELPRRVLDTLNQKLSVQVQKRKKYLTSNQRKLNNKTFRTSEKKFYRNLRKPNTDTQNELDIPHIEQVEEYWSRLWSTAETHKQAHWIQDEKENHRDLPEMHFEEISIQQLTTVLTRTHNWKSPGPDKLQNFWYKRLTCTHEKIAAILTECIKHPDLFPAWLSQGVTYLLPKSASFQGDPAKGRPITCLNTIYKILTACISNALYEHLTNNNIMAEEQKGCVRMAKGCKEQLTIDQIVLEQASKDSRNLHACYIDYQKCFDSLPHSWLLEILSIYRVNPTIIRFLTSTMQNWKTVIEIIDPNQRDSSRTNKTNTIQIKKGIYQGDCLSALWFCVALNPLSNLLRTTKIGFDIKSERRVLYKINHLVYMDDLKLYAASKNKLNELIQIVAKFSSDIQMKFGIDKCRFLSIHAGRMINTQEQGPMAIEPMSTDELYKYLGVMQSKQVAHSEMKKRLQTEFKSRLHKLMKSKLNGKNLVKAVNTYAIPAITYSFGIIKWTQTDLRNLQRTIRTTMTQYNYHHPKSCVERMILPRRNGGRGVLDIEALHDKQVKSLREYFVKKGDRSPLIKAIVEVDNRYTPLNLKSETYESSSLTTDEKENRWAQKSLHGRYYHALHDTNVDQEMSNRWLGESGLFAETEGFMLAIQDEVIATRNHIKYIIKDSNAPEDRCRRCGSTGETIDHVVSACPTLAQSDYLKRHNNVAKILYLELLKQHQIMKDPRRYYTYTPEPIIENENVKIYYDRTLHTGHTREHNRPDITIVDKKTKTATLVDIAVPLSRNMTRTRHEKINKYSDLAVEIKTMWNLNSVRIVPIIISSVGLIPKTLRGDLASLHLKPELIMQMQKAVIIDTCHTVRKFLQ